MNWARADDSNDVSHFGLNIRDYIDSTLSKIERELDKNTEVKTYLVIYRLN